jgi:GAF domain-containing protein
MPATAHLPLRDRIARALTAARDPVAGFRQVLRVLLEFDGLDSGGIYTFDPPTGDLVLRTHVGLSDRFVELSSRYGADSPHARLARAGQPVYRRHADILPSLMTAAKRQEGLLAVAVIPVWHAGRVVGVLNVGSHTMAEMLPQMREQLEAAARDLGPVIARLQG